MGPACSLPRRSINLARQAPGQARHSVLGTATFGWRHGLGGEAVKGHKGAAVSPLQPRGCRVQRVFGLVRRSGARGGGTACGVACGCNVAGCGCGKAEHSAGPMQDWAAQPGEASDPQGGKSTSAISREARAQPASFREARTQPRGAEGRTRSRAKRGGVRRQGLTACAAAGTALPPAVPRRPLRPPPTAAPTAAPSPAAAPPWPAQKGGRAAC